MKAKNLYYRIVKNLKTVECTRCNFTIRYRNWSPKIVEEMMQEHEDRRH